MTINCPIIWDIDYLLTPDPLDPKDYLHPNFYSSQSNIGAGMFKGCVSLKELNMEQMTYYPTGALRDLPSLHTLTLGQRNIAYIEEYAVTGCDIQHIVCMSAVPPQVVGVGEPIECDKSTCVVTVPAGYADAYKASPYWSQYTNIVEDESITPQFGASELAVFRRIGDAGFVLNDDLTTVSVALPCYRFERMEGDTPIFSNHPVCDIDYSPSELTVNMIPNVTISGKEYKVTGVAPYAFCMSSDHNFNRYISSECHEIGAYAFYGASSYNNTAIKLPGTLKKIGYKALVMSTRPPGVECRAVVPPEMDESAFGDRSEIDLYVPLHSGARYSNAPGWRDFRSIIEKFDLGVEDISDDIPTGEPTYYSLDGLKVELDTARPGIYIERCADGTTSKVMRR